jgi:hypothetical protein
MLLYGWAGKYPAGGVAEARRLHPQLVRQPDFRLEVLKPLVPGCYLPFGW